LDNLESGEHTESGQMWRKSYRERYRHKLVPQLRYMCLKKCSFQLETPKLLNCRPYKLLTARLLAELAEREREREREREKQRERELL
jgi:hypothetical protein